MAGFVPGFVAAADVESASEDEVGAIGEIGSGSGGWPFCFQSWRN